MTTFTQTAMNPYDRYIQDKNFKFFEDCTDGNGDLAYELSRIVLYRTEWSKDVLMLLGFTELKDSRIKSIHFSANWTHFNLQCCASLFSLHNKNRLKIESQIITETYSKFTFAVQKDDANGVWRNHVTITY